MKFLTKHFFAGVATGLALAILLFAVAVGVFSFMVLKNMPDTSQLTAMLQEPTFPAADADLALGQADYAWPLQTLDGRETSLAEFKGRVVFLNLWATWCKPCVAEMPAIERLSQLLSDADVAFVLVSVEDSKRVQKFVEEHGLKLPVCVAKAKPPGVFDTKTIPATYILSRGGDVVFKHIGSAKWDGQASVAFLERVVAPDGPQ